MKCLIPLFFIACVDIGQGNVKVISAKDPDDGIVTSNKNSVKIVGGEAISIKSAPYQVAVLNSTTGEVICGGTLINQINILTAAHCVYDLPFWYISVRAGADAYNSGGELRVGSGITCHRDFNKDVPFNNDIALVRVDPIYYNSKIQPVKLPLAGSLPPVGSDAFISGWGKTSSGGVGSDILLGTVVNIDNQTDCNSAYGGRITDRMICASAPGKDMCKGDYGGPLIINGTLYGIASFGEGCADPNYPGVYSSVANEDIRSWIKWNAKL